MPQNKYQFSWQSVFNRKKTSSPPRPRRNYSTEVVQAYVDNYMSAEGVMLGGQMFTGYPSNAPKITPPKKRQKSEDEIFSQLVELVKTAPQTYTIDGMYEYTWCHLYYDHSERWMEKHERYGTRSIEGVIKERPVGVVSCSENFYLTNRGDYHLCPQALLFHSSMLPSQFHEGQTLEYFSHLDSLGIDYKMVKENNFYIIFLPYRKDYGQIKRLFRIVALRLPFFASQADIVSSFLLFIPHMPFHKAMFFAHLMQLRDNNKIFPRWTMLSVKDFNLLDAFKVFYIDSEKDFLKQLDTQQRLFHCFIHRPSNTLEDYGFDTRREVGLNQGVLSKMKDRPESATEILKGEVEKAFSSLGFSVNDFTNFVATVINKNPRYEEDEIDQEEHNDSIERFQDAIDNYYKFIV